MTFSLGGIDFGGDPSSFKAGPCRFVAEISNNHNGDFDAAIRLIDAAKHVGADFVKFQCYTPSELVQLRGDGLAPEPWGSQGWTMRALYEKAATPLEWFPDLFQHARDIGIVPFSSVFGLESLTLLEKCACPFYKIARLDSHDRGLYEAVASRRKPVLVSTDMYQFSVGYESENVHRLYCPPGYPTAVSDVRLPQFGGWQYKQRGFLGLSSHCLDLLLPIVAVARGCELIEMHMMLDDAPSELEANVSLPASEFALMVGRVRQAEALLG